MSKKHHVKKEGGSSNYPQRLADRGVSSSQVRMPFIDRQGRKHDSPDHLMKSEARRGE